MGRSRAQDILNIAAVALLLMIVVCFLVMPRYNYDEILTRVVRMEAQIARLEARVEKLNILAGENESRRAAVLGQIDFIASHLKKQDQDLVSFLEHLVETSGRLDAISDRLSQSQRGTGPHEAERVTNPPGAIESGAGSLAKLSGPLPEDSSADPELQQIASELSPRQIAEMNFEEFWSQLLSGGIAVISGREIPERIEETRMSRLKLVFSSYRSCIDVINLSEKLLIEELVERATRDEDYLDERKQEGPPKLRTPKEGGTVYVKDLSGGRRREFRFSSEAHPEFGQIEALRSRALKALLVVVRSTVRL